jgi:cholesterol oxidase
MITAFGVGDLHAMEHLGVMLTKQLAVDAGGVNRYVHHAPTFDLPLHFIVGNHNHLFLPESTARTLRFLEDGNQNGTYTSKLYDDYAHLDLFVGRDAAKDVFPDIRDALLHPGQILNLMDHEVDEEIEELLSRPPTESEEEL